MAEQTGNSRDRLIDELLVLRCQDGYKPAFELLVRRWQRRLWRYARSLTDCSEAAWDITQETWIAVFRQIRRLNDPAWFGAWVCRIVRNKCADHCRRAGRQRNLVQAIAEQQEDTGTRNPADHDDAVKSALEKLPPDKRERLILRYREGLNVVEIALVLGVPAGTVKSRLHHAREYVRRILEGDES